MSHIIECELGVCVMMMEDLSPYNGRMNVILPTVMGKRDTNGCWQRFNDNWKTGKLTLVPFLVLLTYRTETKLTMHWMDSFFFYPWCFLWRFWKGPQNSVKCVNSCSNCSFMCCRNYWEKAFFSNWKNSRERPPKFDQQHGKTEKTLAYVLPGWPHISRCTVSCTAVNVFKHTKW